MCIVWLQVLSRHTDSSSLIKGEESAPTCKPPFTRAQLPLHPALHQWPSLLETPMVSGPFWRGRPRRDALLLGAEFLSWGASTSKSLRLFCLSLPPWRYRGWLRAGLGSSPLSPWLSGPQWLQTLAQKPGATCGDMEVSMTGRSRASEVCRSADLLQGFSWAVWHLW